MADKQKTPTWLITVIATLFALIVVFLAWELIHKMGNVNFSTNLTVENWFSFLVSLIGVFVTIFVGLQIYNSVESKRAMKDAEEKFETLKDKIEEDFNSMRKEYIDLTKGNNDFRIEMLERHNSLSKNLDWGLKEIKKEYWKEITNLNQTIEESKKSQKDINTEMKDISSKWEGILSAQNDFRDAICKSFIVLADTNNDNEIKLYLLLSAVSVFDNFTGHQSTLNLLLDNIINAAGKIKEPIVLKNACQSMVYNSLNKIPIDTKDGQQDIINKKLHKAIYLIEEIPDSSQPQEEAKLS